VSDLSRFRDTFFQEAAEHLEAMESTLLSLNSGRADPDALNCIFRCAHSMKAGAGMFGFDAIRQFTHVLENLLDRMRNGEVAVSAARTELLLRSVDLLRKLLDGAARGETGTPPELGALLAELSATPIQPAETEYAIRFEPEPDLFRLGLDPFLVLSDLAGMGRILTVEADLSRLPPLAALEPDVCYLGWQLRLATSATVEEIRDVFAFVEDVATVSIEPAAGGATTPSPAVSKTVARAPAREGSIRVTSEKVDRLIDLVGELVIAQSMTAQIMNGFTADRLPRLQEAIADVDRYTRELQERAMRIRMLPIGSIFSRFPRLAHDTAQLLAKQVALQINGEETELDKSMVERITDPLTHLVRNAIDHGIETPEERRQAGKPPEGSLRLSAHYEGGNVIVQVSDDGRGLDTARIRAKAIERSLIGAGDELNDEQIHALVFRPGFSTAKTVSDLSGRGVGLDVVKQSVEAVNGTVAVHSMPGGGCEFRLKLPLTLAIMDGLLLKVGEQTYILPLVSIVESIRPRREQVHGMAGRGEVIVVRNEPLPLVRLHRIFRVPTEVEEPSRGLTVIVEHERRQLALLVDELLGQQQVVIKSLETNFRKVKGITGATILGDGRAALILDVAGIVEMSRAGRSSAAA
jgi:two-component system, chemotaxis family, sensor kinase CheA